MRRRRDSGGVRKRGAVWWIYYRHLGRQWDESARTGDEREARSFLAQRRRELRDGTWRPPHERAVDVEVAELRARLAELEAVAAPVDPPLTVAAYFEAWIKGRHAADVRTAHDEEVRIRSWVLPSIGEKPIAEVTRTDMRDMVATMRDATSPTTGKPYSPRSVLHVYGAARIMFGDAVHEGKIAATPCTLRVRKGELPTKRDADPRWRAESVYTRDEAEQLISDERIAFDRRVLYAMMLLAGLRSAEATGRRWRDYDAAAQPLGRLVVATQARSDMPERSTKTGSAAEVPVHPALAAILADWRLRGFALFFGRHPSPEDLIVPSRADGRSPRSKTLLTRLKEDLEALGFRTQGRGRHAMRATFLSLGAIDGANPAILRRVTHAPPTDVGSGYVRIGWPALCAEVAKLRIELRRGIVVRLPKAAGTDSRSAVLCTDSDTDSDRRPSGFGLEIQRDGRDSKRSPARESGAFRESAADRGAFDASRDPEKPGPRIDRTQTLTQTLTVRLRALESRLRAAGDHEGADAVRDAIAELSSRE